MGGSGKYVSTSVAQLVNVKFLVFFLHEVNLSSALQLRN